MHSQEDLQQADKGHQRYQR